MKNLTIEEKRALDTCVFRSLAQSQKSSLYTLWLKIKNFFSKKHH